MALLCAAAILLVAAGDCLAQQAKNDAGPAADAAHQMADFFSQIGDQIYEDCIFELSPEQLEVQAALTTAYIEHGASAQVARRLAVKQIQPPKLSEKCEAIRHQQPQEAEEPQAPALPDWSTSLSVPKTPNVQAEAKPPPGPIGPPPTVVGNRPLPQWDCGPNVDYVTVRLHGTERKLTGGEICNPYEDVVREVPSSVPTFRLGYTISTGRLFIISDNAQAAGKTIAWAISGRDACRNNPTGDCLAARALGPLPPGEYAFGGDKGRRVTWGPRTKRNVVGIYLKKLWNREQFSKEQTKAILARGNIAIHVRLKGEMSEACIGLEPKGWSYVAQIVNEGRATGLSVYLDEPYPQVAEAPPVVEGSSFSLTSLFQ